MAKSLNKKTTPQKAMKPARTAKSKSGGEKSVEKLVQKSVEKSAEKSHEKLAVKKMREPEFKAKPKMKPISRVPVPEEPMVEIPQAAAVPTNGRPRKNLAGISPKELELFRDAILAKRREIVGDMSSMEREALRSSSGSNLSNLPLHMADMGTDNYEQEFTLGLMEKERKLLRDLNDALAKIQNGTYGICEGTGKPISKPRLEAQPWARYSIEYARKLEGRLR